VSVSARKLRAGIGLVVITGSVAWALVESATVHGEPAPALKRRESVAQRILAQEPRLRERSRKQFPYDHWSQDDAFGAMEQAAVRSAAAVERADLGSVLDAVDAAMHRHPSAQRKAGASPCKPRPFYD
jgi:hypothetical protein